MRSRPLDAGWTCASIKPGVANAPFMSINACAAVDESRSFITQGHDAVSFCCDSRGERQGPDRR